MSKLFNLTLVLVFALFLVNCQQAQTSNVAFPANETKTLTVDEAAIRIVSKDIKANVAADDIRVKRVKYLLSELSDKNLSLHAQGNALELSVQMLEDKKGIKLSMLQYLEEMKKAKDSKVAESLNQKPDFLTLTSIVAVTKER